MSRMTWLPPPSPLMLPALIATPIATRAQSSEASEYRFGLDLLSVLKARREPRNPRKPCLLAIALNIPIFVMLAVLALQQSARGYVAQVATN